MHIVAEKKIIQTGEHRAEKGRVAQVPEVIGKAWVEAKFARLATEAEVKAAEAAKSKGVS